MSGWVLSALLVSAAVPCAAGRSHRSPVQPFRESLIVDGGGMALSRIEAGTEATMPVPTSSRWTPDTAIPTVGAGPLLDAALAAEAQVPLTPRPRAFEYSDAYRTRAKIHRYASYTMLPLFVAQFAVGQKLYNGHGSESTRSVHGALATGTGVLFGVNTITGGWNLYEGRKDPHRKTKRVVHGVLMLVADAGFIATGALAPDDEGEGGVSRSTHRTLAFSSMGVATASYLIMLLSH